MKLLLFGLLFFACAPVTGQDIVGDWQGALTVNGSKIRLVFHITRTGGVYSSTFDSPDQGAMGMKASSTVVENDSIKIGIAAIGGGYKGKWNRADGITGTLSQGPMNMQVDLARQALAYIPAKPQTPKGPFDYTSEDVAYENKTQQVHLEGTLTKPKNDTKFPVVILITGSGPQDRDETIGLHKSFFVIADYFTKQGIAVLRVDDRGVGKSTGNFSASTSADFATDVMAAISYLKTRKDIDTTKIGLLGHSEGATIAPYVAARSKDVAFIVMLAGPVEGGKKTMYYQAVTKPLQKEPENVRNAYGILYNQMLRVGLEDSIAANEADFVKRAYLKWKSQQPVETVIAITHGASDKELTESFAQSFADLKRPWWRFTLTYDPQNDLKKLQIPVLALNGSRDEQVNPDNLLLIKNILTANKNPHFKVQEVPGVNHLFQHCKDCGSIAEYLALDETFDKETLALMAGWIKTTVGL